MQTVAILGTGKMGSAIATRLSEAGFEVVLWNRTRSRAEALGIGTVADTPAAAAGNADFVISSLTGPEAVLAAYLGSDGALSTGAGKRIVEMSTAEARRFGYIEDRQTPTQFALRDLRKDVDFAMDLFGKSGASTPLTRSSRELVSAAAAEDPDLDISAVVRLYGRAMATASR
jgi:3-hydroxyisobutyrate dehydrogenase-like beta-hydroxyacid dehydrogenase